MPCIKCDCTHLYVCAHRGEIESAFRRVMEIGRVEWGNVTCAIEQCCPYRTPKAVESAATDSQQANTAIALAQCDAFIESVNLSLKKLVSAKSAIKQALQR